MPIFQYECSDCGGVREYLRKNNEDIPEECEACGKGLGDFVVFSRVYAGETPARTRSSGDSGGLESEFKVCPDDCPVKQILDCISNLDPGNN